jgi:formylglycine-generating enzyme required for sulfatase activity
LLSEAEYEYAARAGTMTFYPWGNDIKLNDSAMANCMKCGSQWDIWRTAPVGSFAANKFGPYDMVGNISEWTEDCRHCSYDNAPADGTPWYSARAIDCFQRVIRGGSNIDFPEKLGSAQRNLSIHDRGSSNIGFRVARTLLAP